MIMAYVLFGDFFILLLFCQFRRFCPQFQVTYYVSIMTLSWNEDFTLEWTVFATCRNAVLLLLNYNRIILTGSLAVPLVEQHMLTLPEYLMSLQCFVGVNVASALVFYLTYCFPYFQFLCVIFFIGSLNCVYWSSDVSTFRPWFWILKYLNDTTADTVIFPANIKR